MKEVYKNSVVLFLGTLDLESATDMPDPAQLSDARSTCLDHIRLLQTAKRV